MAINPAGANQKTTDIENVNKSYNQKTLVTVLAVTATALALILAYKTSGHLRTTMAMYAAAPTLIFGLIKGYDLLQQRSREAAV